MDLKVDVSLDRPDKIIEVHENLPIFPSYSVIIGAGSSGKTLMLCSLLHNISSVFKGRVIVFTNSHSDTLIHTVEKLDGVIHHSINSPKTGKNIIQEVLDYQMTLKEEGKKLKPILILLDDFVDDAVMNKRRSVLTKLYTMGRHANITTFTVSQSFRMLPSALRKLSHYYMIYGTGNTKERKAISEELSGMLSEKEFLKYYDDITKTKYNFLTVDNNKQRLLRNLEEVIWRRD